MPRHINSAYRAYIALSRAAELHPNSSARNVWIKTFGIGEETEREDFFVIVDKLRLLESEIRSAQAQMMNTDFSPDLFAPAFSAALEAVDPRGIDQLWESRRQQLNSSTLNALRFCSELLPDEETPLAEDELQAVWDRLTTLHESLAGSALPDEVLAFVKEQIKIIEHALSEYEILGAKAFRRAIVEGSLSYSEHESVVTENQNTQAVREITGIWQQVANVTQRAETVQKLLASGVKIARLIGGIADQVNRVV
jgi:hypothetical protein